MGKSNGSTRNSSAGSPRGLGAGEMPYTPERGYAPPVSEKERDLEEIAERLYASRELTVDPGDAVFEQARNLYNSSIEDSIENTTDYIAQVDRQGNIYIQSKFTPEADAIREYGTERVSIPMGSRSLMDIINELRVSRESDIFRKYR